MSKNSKKNQKAAREQKRDAWQSERDDDQAREEAPDDEYQGIDEFPQAVKDFRS